MKVLYVSYDGMTDALGRSQVVPYLLGLSALGHVIHVVSCEKKQVGVDEKEEVAGIFRDHNISWSPLSFTSRPPWAAKLLDVVKIKNKVEQLHKKINFDIVHCRSYIAALAGLDLKRKYNVKFVFDMRGFWANERIEGDMWNLNNPVYSVIYKYFKRKEHDFFREADAVVSLTHNGKGVIRELFGVEAHKKVSVIPCCVDTDFFCTQKIDPDQKTILQRKLGLKENDFVISYLGSTGTWYMTDEMLHFFKVLLKKYPNARFLFISGDQPDYILAKARAQGISPERIVVARASRNLVPLFLSLSTVSLFFIRPVFSKKASSPTKQAEIMSMGIPLICNAGVGDTDMIFSDQKAGLVLNGFGKEEFEGAIAHVEKLIQLDPVQIRNKAIQFFNLNDGVEMYHRIYNKITRKNASIE